MYLENQDQIISVLASSFLGGWGEGGWEHASPE